MLYGFFLEVPVFKLYDIKFYKTLKKMSVFNTQYIKKFNTLDMSLSNITM